MAKRPEVDLEKIKSRVEKRIKKASEHPLNLAFVVYGRPKVGKTRFCATMPDPLIIDCDEKGTDSVRDSDPSTSRITTWTELNDLYWYLQAGDHPYKSVAIDTVSGLQTICMNFVLGDEVARDASRDPDMPTRQAYGKVSQLMRTQITNFRNLPMNVVFTAHTRTRTTGEDEEDESFITGPNLSPAIYTHLLGAVGLIGYMMRREVFVKGTKTVNGKKKKTRKKVSRTRLVIGPSDRFETGVRYTALHDFEHIDAPNFADMLTTIKQGGKSGKA
jgi:phage nucleotide-binding protein